MSKLPDTRTLSSKDKRRAAVYKRIPEGWAGRRPAYRLVRTYRGRRGFGTIVHAITTFTPRKDVAAQMAARWVRSERTFKVTINGKDR